MRLFIHAHYYQPHTLAGAEKFLHEIAKFMQGNRHEVIVSSDHTGEYSFEGIKVVPNNNVLQYYIWADKILTHLVHSGEAIQLAAQFKKPLYHLLHNNNPRRELFAAPENNFVIYNSDALKKELNIPLPSAVIHPVIWLKDWANDKDHYFNEYVTLVNVCKEKGGLILQQLAEAMPETRFLGIKGGYNIQIIQNSSHRNIQFMPEQSDMRAVYNQTRLIIMPSDYESWGLVASEAMASGIPVICSDTPGLRENCGNAALYVERRASAYRDAIRLLNDLTVYHAHVKRGLQQNAGNDLHKLLHFMTGNAEATQALPVTEKEEMPPVKEKKELLPPGAGPKEKKEIEKPGRKRGRPPKILV